jgi:hypothetical protein
MPTVEFGNESVLEPRKKDDTKDASPDNVELKVRKDLGRRVTTMSLNEVDGDNNPSRGMNLTMATRLWPMQSDRPPSWVDSEDDLLAELLADQYDCPVGRPKSWKAG